MRFTAKAGDFIALVPVEALDPDARHAGFSVVVTADGVRSFASQWPCNGFRSYGPVRFDFDSAGDLVDIPYGDKEAVNPDAGPAQLALSQDAQEFGEGVIERRRAWLLSGPQAAAARNAQSRGEKS